AQSREESSAGGAFPLRVWFGHGLLTPPSMVVAAASGAFQHGGVNLDGFSVVEGQGDGGGVADLWRVRYVQHHDVESAGGEFDGFPGGDGDVVDRDHLRGAAFRGLHRVQFGPVGERGGRLGEGDVLVAGVADGEVAGGHRRVGGFRQPGVFDNEVAGFSAALGGCAGVGG